jgi:hypothetical protein
MHTTLLLLHSLKNSNYYIMDQLKLKQKSTSEKCQRELSYEEPLGAIEISGLFITGLFSAVRAYD